MGLSQAPRASVGATAPAVFSPYLSESPSNDFTALSVMCSPLRDECQAHTMWALTLRRYGGIITTTGKGVPEKQKSSWPQILRACWSTREAHRGPPPVTVAATTSRTAPSASATSTQPVGPRGQPCGERHSAPPPGLAECRRHELPEQVFGRLALRVAGGGQRPRCSPVTCYGSAGNGGYQESNSLRE